MRNSLICSLGTSVDVKCPGVVTGQRLIDDLWVTIAGSGTMTTENHEKSEVYEFGDCVLDADRRDLSVAGKSVTTQPKAFELLLYLVRNRHRAVDKDELQDQLWPRSIVTETALTRCVMKARRAVNDDADRQSVIKTVHGHGYRFIAEIKQPATPETVTTCLLYTSDAADE